jgi:hypothetical protein
LSDEWWWHFSILNLHYSLGTSPGIEYFTERHAFGFFSFGGMRRACAQAGLARLQQK